MSNTVIKTAYNRTITVSTFDDSLYLTVAEKIWHHCAVANAARAREEARRLDAESEALKVKIAEAEVALDEAIATTLSLDPVTGEWGES